MSAELEPMQTVVPFDYSQFDEQTAQALQNYAFRALQVARTYYRDLMEIVVGAHQLLCGPLVHDVDNSRFGNRGEDTFRAWCTSVHISKSKAYQLLQIQSFMDTCTPEEQSTLALLPFTAMRELVTGDTPEQVITMAKEGKVGTSKEVLELKAQLKAEKERADAAEAHLEAAHADINGLTERAQKAESERDKARADQLSTAKDCNRLGLKVSQEKDRADKAEAREEEAWKLQSKAETRAQEAEKQLEGSRQMAEAAKLRGDKLKAENDALKKQPITAVVDKEEVERQAREMAAEMTADLRAQLEQTASGSEQDAHSSYDNVLLADRSFQNIGKMVVPSLRRLPPEQREQLTNMLVHTLGQIQGEVSKCL